MSDIVKTPGQVLFEFLRSHSIFPSVRMWHEVIQSDQQVLESAAIAAHEAVERQRRESESRVITVNCAKCKSPVKLDHNRTCNVCGLVQSEE